MSRMKRIWRPGFVYHITSRGNNKQVLFLNNADYNTYINEMKNSLKYFEDDKYEVYSYCIMNNHVHILMRCNLAKPGKLMARINKKYADYYNKKYGKSGHVFQQRYYAKIMKDGFQILDVSRYIHKNPVKAKLVKKAEDYKWSSYKKYLDKDCRDRQCNFVFVDEVLKYFNDFPFTRYISYKKFVEEKDE